MPPRTRSKEKKDEEEKQKKMIGDTVFQILSNPTDATVGNVSVIVSKGLVMEGTPNENLQESVRFVVTTTLLDEAAPNELQGSVVRVITTKMDQAGPNELRESVEGVITTKMNQPTVKHEDGSVTVNGLQASTFELITEYMKQGAGVVGRQGRQTNGMQDAVMELSRHAMGETEEGKAIIRSIIKEEEEEKSDRDDGVEMVLVNKNEYNQLKQDVEDLMKTQKPSTITMLLAAFGKGVLLVMLCIWFMWRKSIKPNMEDGRIVFEPLPEEEW